MSDAILVALRMQAWERAKGELNALLQTYCGDDAGKPYLLASSKIEEFVKDFEGWCC